MILRSGAANLLWRVTEYDFCSPSDVKKEDYILVNEKA